MYRMWTRSWYVDAITNLAYTLTFLSCTTLPTTTPKVLRPDAFIHNLLCLPSFYQKHINKLKLWKREYYTSARLALRWWGRDRDNGWGRGGTEAIHRQRKKDHADSTICPTGFWWDCTWFRTRKGTNQPHTNSPHLSFYAENCYEAHSTASIQLKSAQRSLKGRKQCIGRGEWMMWAAGFFPLGFDEAIHHFRYGKGPAKKDQLHTTSSHLSSYAKNC